MSYLPCKGAMQYAKYLSGPATEKIKPFRSCPAPPGTWGRREGSLRASGPHLRTDRSTAAESFHCLLAPHRPQRRQKQYCAPRNNYHPVMQPKDAPGGYRVQVQSLDDQNRRNCCQTARNPPDDFIRKIPDAIFAVDRKGKVIYLGIGP